LDEIPNDSPDIGLELSRQLRKHVTLERHADQ
jgi:hypothetical protein